MATNFPEIPPFENGSLSDERNIANNIRRDDDTVKFPEVTLYDIDYAITYHLTENLKLRVTENDTYITVPVLYADGEKWAQFRTHGYLRDKAGKIMHPLITLRRTSVDKDDRLPMPDMNKYKGMVKFFPYIQSYERYDRYGAQTLRKPSLESYMVPMANFIRVSYELIILTRTMAQLNSLTQQIMSVSDHMWGDFHTFRTVATNAQNNISNNTGEDRIVTATIQLQVDGFLMDEYEYQEKTMQKQFSLKTIRVLNEQEEVGIYITEPSFNNAPRHMSTEAYIDMQKAGKRNIRYR